MCTRKRFKTPWNLPMRPWVDRGQMHTFQENVSKTKAQEVHERWSLKKSYSGGLLC
jgi:hypothetical protein